MTGRQPGGNGLTGDCGLGGFEEERFLLTVNEECS
jgi:hypothetical protein